mgnify:CR=1 FL=1
MTDNPSENSPVCPQRPVDRTDTSVWTCPPTVDAGMNLSVIIGYKKDVDLL